MSDHINQIQKLAGTADSADKAQEMQAGTLNKYDNDEWMFTGNGVTTPTQVMGRIIEVDLGDEPTLAPLRQQAAAARYAAVQMLMTRNRHLLQGQGDGQPTPTPDVPVPEGQQFFAEGGMTLKQLLAPFKDRLGDLEKVVSRLAQPPGSGGVGRATARAEQKVIGNVWSAGRPIE